MRPVAGYKPFAELARGAAVVYKAYDPRLGRTVLLKVLSPEAAEDPALVAWFEGEARAVAAVEHENVVALYDAGRDDGQPFLAAEFVEGRALGDVLAEGPLPADLAAYVAASAARGLAAAHERGLIHRDVKPGNVLLAADGMVKITDFGLASRVGAGEGDGLAETRGVRGTPGYLAPEVVSGSRPGPAADLFALGAVLVEALTGRAAFPSNGAADALDAALHHDPVPALRADLRVPRGLADIAEQLLAKAPGERPASATEVAALLDAHRGPANGRADTPAGRVGAGDLAAFLGDPAAYRAARPATPVQVAVQAARAVRPLRRASTLLALGLLAGLAATALALRASRETGPSVVEAPAERTGGITIGPAAPNPFDGTDVVTEPAPPPAPPPDTEQDPAEPPAEVPVEPDRGRDPPAVAGTEPAPPQVEASEPAPGQLVVAVEPWAEVFIDGRRVGTTPLGAPVSLAAGAHRVVLRNPEFPEHAVQVDVGPGATERVAVSLWSMVGRLSLEVSPWAEVAVDGRAVGTTPLRRPLVLSPGVHTIRLAHPTLGIREEQVTVSAGEARTVRVRMGQGSEVP